ncbi:hypothetical protein B2J88_43760 [Rhodococcus sp. SRB_17]|nr:hypothetical protein [Rhodococcus sp. SRB_17]
MIGIAGAFAPTYARAHTQFLEAAATAGLAIASHRHPLAGSAGEDLAMDVVREGPADADRLLIVSSACHGVEGFCGSGVQVFALHDAEWRDLARAHGVAVLYVHAVNPYGFSHTRRATHENVDLNRNFHDFSQPLPVNEAYRAVHPLLLPDAWPPSPQNAAAVAGFIAAHGAAAWQAAITRGQHEFSDGLYYGGTAPAWSNRVLREVLRTHGRGAQRVAWIDLHTGLGPSGHGERIFVGRDDAAAVQRARQWWGGGGATPVTSLHDGTSSSAFLTGLMALCLPEECPQAEDTCLALEFGTLPVAEVLDALRAEQWLQLHPEAPAAQARAIKEQMRAAFYTDTDAWKGQIISQARQAMFQAVQGLSS